MSLGDDDDILDDGSADLRRGDGLSADTRASLARAAKYGRYYLYLAGAGVIVGLLSNTVAVDGPAAAALLPALLFGYLLGAALVAYPAYQFYRFATLPQSGEDGGAIVALASTLRYFGIFIAVIVLLYVGLIAIGVVAAIAGSLLS